MTASDSTFFERYGPWALVVGASEGVGAAYARAMAERGLNVVLISRRQAVLDDLAATIRADYGVETQTIAVDLTTDGAAATVLDATSALEVGMLMYCAGADSTYEPFLANPVDVPLALVHRNCIVPMQLCHHFAGPMVERETGGVVLVSSGAGFAGGQNMVAYGASKAFDMVMAEALWAEIHDKGVDVLALVLGVTDTPALRRLLARRGILESPDGPLPFPGVASPDEVVAEALANLSDGPTWIVGEESRQHAKQLRSLSRNDAVKLMLEGAGGIMENTRDADLLETKG